jgi:hypothetical protein
MAAMEVKKPIGLNNTKIRFYNFIKCVLSHRNFALLITLCESDAFEYK